MRHAPAFIASLMLAAVTGCSFFNFFGYEEDTGLYVIEAPDSYRSAKLGLRLAATGSGGNDLIAASGGRGEATLFFRLGAEGDLVNAVDPWKQYLAGADEVGEAKDSGSGASLAGLPSWGEESSGCLAIGEPEARRVIIDCEPGNTIKKINIPDEKEFGHSVAAIRPGEGGRWLLAAAGRRKAWVYSDHAHSEDNRSVTLVPATAEDPREIHGLGAGRLGDRFFVALAARTTGQATSTSEVHLFVQREPNSRAVDEVACFSRTKEIGFGGVMTTGDLNGDGMDELLVSGADIKDRKNAVYVYDVTGLADGFTPGDPSPSCAGVSPDPLATLKPVEGDLDVECDDECDFGTSLVVGDIATDDGGPEIMIGAPGAVVEGVKEGGAVYVWRGKEVYQAKGGLITQIADSNPERGHRFGGGLTVAPMAGRNELVVGVTGKGQIIVAFCTGVGEDIEKGADVTTDGDGSVVSTRCRP